MSLPDPPDLRAISARLRRYRGVDEPEPDEDEPEDDPEATPSARHLHLTSATDIAPRAVRWLWDQRIPVGELTLLAGRESIGKSTVEADLIARITQGTLPGRHRGTPRSVVVAATEDSWAHTIVPRLLAAGADLTRVFRCDVVTAAGEHGTLTLPDDHTNLRDVLADLAVVLLVLDPLMSRFAGSLDTYKDAETRRRLEPLVAVGQATRTAVLGLIHVNKSANNSSSLHRRR